MYREEIAILRASVNDITSIPDGAAALARHNAGDEAGALPILDDLTRARDKARQKRELMESASDRRQSATLAIDARDNGKITTEQSIARFEEVTQHDPGVHWDWVQFGCLYRSLGRLSDASAASQLATYTADSERDHDVALNELGNAQERHGEVAATMASYRKAIAIAETVAGHDPSNSDWLHRIPVSYKNLGDVQLMQGDLS